MIKGMRDLGVFDFPGRHTFIDILDLSFPLMDNLYQETHKLWILV